MVSVKGDWCLKFTEETIGVKVDYCSEGLKRLFLIFLKVLAGLKI